MVPRNMSFEQINLFPVGMRVLVVDDDPLCLMITERMLKRCSYSGEPHIDIRYRVEATGCKK